MATIIFKREISNTSVKGLRYEILSRKIFMPFLVLFGFSLVPSGIFLALFGSCGKVAKKPMVRFGLLKRLPPVGYPSHDALS